MRPDSENIKKIIECLQKLQPKATEEELERTAQNLYQLGLFLVQAKLKKHSQSLQTQSTGNFEQVKDNSP